MFFEFIEFSGSMVLFSNIIFERSPNRPWRLFKLNGLNVGYRRFKLGWILLESP